jgi:hypothetical protein
VGDAEKYNFVCNLFDLVEINPVFLKLGRIKPNL